MDILQKYNEENLEVARQNSPWQLPEECSFLVCMVMKWSGGRITNERQANIVLVIFSLVIFGIALVIAVNPFGSARPVPSGIINQPGQPPRLGPTTAP